MVLSGIYRTWAENDENEQGLKNGPLTARRKLLWECGGSVLNVALPYYPVWPYSSTPSTTSWIFFFLKGKWSSDHSKMFFFGREQNLVGLGSNKEELLLFQLFLFLQKGGNAQSWCGLNQVILLSSFCKTPLSCLLNNTQMFWHSRCCLIFIFFSSLLYESCRSVLDTRGTSQIGFFVSSALSTFCRAGGGLRAD